MCLITKVMNKNVRFSILKFFFLLTILSSFVNVFAINGKVDFSNSKNIGSGYSNISEKSIFTFIGK